MKRFAALCSGVAAVVLGSSASAFAGDLVTPMLYVGSTTNVACKLVNISTAPLTVNVRMMSGTTNTLLDESTPVEVAAGDTLIVFENAPLTQVYCRFVGAKKTKVRASISSFDPMGDASDAVVMSAY